ARSPPEPPRRTARPAGREQQVGHSFLLGPDGTPLATPVQFAEVFRHELLPLLQEFAYEDFGELARYLGSDLIDREAQSLTIDPTQDPEGLLGCAAAEFQDPPSSWWAGPSTSLPSGPTSSWPMGLQPTPTSR